MERLRGAVVDGRMENVRYRQNQLHRLHATLRNNASTICDAISTDTSSETTAEIEFYLAMDSVKKAYETLDFESSMKEQYLVTEGKDNLGRRVGVGLVAIRPMAHSRFYSVVTPLAMAIAAGNCVLLEIVDSILKIDLVLRTILPNSLDRDIFEVLSRKLTPSESLEVDLVLDQTTSAPENPRQDSSISTIRSLAIVDRSAEIQKAAKEIVDSRLSQSSYSPYLPDLTIVNEFVCEDFKNSCWDWAAKMKFVGLQEDKDDESRKVVNQAEQAGQVKISKSPTSGLIIVEIMDRLCPLAAMKVRGPYLVMVRSTGIIDTITSQRGLPLCIATYIYSDPATAKAISEQIASSATYINQIPPQLLIGPISPTSQPHSLHPRYTPSTFSASRPQFIVPVSALPSSFQKLRESAMEPLRPTGQRPGHAVGFFEQGIFIGLGVVSLVVLPLLGTVFWTVGKKSFAMLR